MWNKSTTEPIGTIMSEENQHHSDESSLAIVEARKQAQLEVTANFRKGTAVAGLCKEIVTRTAVTIQGNKYVPAASWEAIAVAHGYVVSTRDVEWVRGEGEGEHRIAGGFRCIAEIKNQQTGMVIATAEGFVGEDEPTWFGGTVTFGDGGTKTYTKRHDSAIRAMVQTRAAGRVCKQAFAHVVVLMNAGLSTTPLEEVSDPDSPESQPQGKQARDKNTPPRLPIYEWKDVRIHFGPKHGPGCDAEHPKGRQLGELSTAALKWFQNEWKPRSNASDQDVRLRRALDISMGKEKPDEKPADPGEAKVTTDEVPKDAKSANPNGDGPPA